MGFGVTYRHRDIWKEQTIASGVRVESPIYDWASAAKAWGYRWEEFVAMPGDEQAFLVAVHRTDRQIDAVLAAEQVRKMKRANKGKQ